MDLVSEQDRFHSLKQQIAAMNSLSYWELQGKRQLGFVKKGEEVYMISSKTPE